ncbi:MAG: IS21-like element helper ATPase IstB [bacterium]
MSDALVLDRIQTSLARLRLPRMGEILEGVMQAAQEKGKSYLGFLDELLEEEIACREQRRVETSLKISGLPFIKGIEEFDFTFQPKLDRQKVMSLFDLTFIRPKGNVIFLGPPGVGKTHLAVSLALKACQAGMSIYFTTMEDLIGKLKKDHGTERKGRGRGYNKSALVIVDEVGYTPIGREECNLFFRFIANRYEKASTVITSNKAFSDWTELFHDPVIVTAFLDRLLHHSIIINIRGNSYRLCEKVGKEGTEMSQNEVPGGSLFTTENGSLKKTVDIMPQTRQSAPLRASEFGGKCSGEFSGANEVLLKPLPVFSRPSLYAVGIKFHGLSVLH